MKLLQGRIVCAVSSSSLLSFMMVIVLEVSLRLVTSTTLLHTIRVAHTTRSVSTTLVEVVLVTHSIRLSTIAPMLRVVLILVLVVVVVRVSSTVSTPTILLVSTRATSMVGICLMGLVVIMGSTITLALSHYLLISKAALCNTTELAVSIVVANSTLVLTHIKLMLTIV